MIRHLKFILRILPLSLSLLLLCQELHAERPMLLPVDSKPLVISAGKKVMNYDVEIASNDEQLERGLMYRTDFPADRVMLFNFATEEMVMMWMANTPIPLDMLFTDRCGKIVGIFKNSQPYSHDIIKSPAPAKFVVELNAGEVAKHNISVGDSISHPVVDHACMVSLK